MADGPYDVPQIAGAYEQEREYYIRRILDRFPNRSTDPALLYGDPKLEFLRLVNEGLIGDGATDLTEVNDTLDSLKTSVATKITRGEVVINVRDFGAKGDGVANDQAAIQSAVDAARDSTATKTVIFPTGSYYIKHVVQLWSGITLQGVGEAKIVKLVGATATVCFGIKSEGRHGYGSGAKDITLRNLHFRGNFAQDRACGAIGANHGSNILVEWCSFEQCTQKGHIFDMGGCENVTIRNCVFRGANYPTENDSYNECIQADNSTRGGTSFTDEPGSYDGLPSRNFFIENNVFEGITVDGVTYPAPIPFGSHWTADGMYHENLNFTGNTVIDPPVDTKSVYHGILHFVGARNVKIENNTFKNSKNVAITAIRTHVLSQSLDPKDSDLLNLPKYPLAVSMVCSDVSIINNRFIGFKNVNTSEAIIAIEGDATMYAHDITIADNTFIDCGPDGYVNVGPNQIELLYARDVTIRDNVSEVSRRFLYFATVAGIKVLTNTIKKASNGVAVNGTKAVGIKVIGNEFDDYAGGFLVSDGNGITVTDNTFRNERTGSFTSINIGGASKRFTVIGNDVLTTVTGSKPVLIQQASLGGIVRNNILSGATMAVQVTADSSATVDGNITV